MNKTTHERKRKFMEAWRKYNKVFGLSLPANKETCGTDEGVQECVDLVNQSCKEGIDYVAERFGLDRERWLEDTKICID